MKRITGFLLAAIFGLGLLAGCTKVPGAGIPSEAREQMYDPDTSAEAPSAQAQAASSEENSADVEPTQQQGLDVSAVDDYMTTIDGVYAIAFVTDGGSIHDGGRNQSVWEGVKGYAFQSGKSYKSYQTYGGNAARDDDRYDAMKEAIRGGAELVVCAGPEQELALRRIAQEYPEVRFMFLEGVPVKDLQGNTISNILPIAFREEQIGYLVGYAAVQDGVSKLGFLGDETIKSRLCGYGFLQGVDAAAGEMGNTATVCYHTEKKAQDTPELRDMLKGWYADDTELIFTSGQAMDAAAAAVAEDSPEKYVSSEIQQEDSAYRVCVNRELREAAWKVCEAFYSDDGASINGMILGVEKDALGLVTEPWNLEHFSVEAYQELLRQMKDGEVMLREEVGSMSQDMFGNITLNLE